MPASRISESPIKVGLYDVVGHDADGLPGFVGHVALANEPRESIIREEILTIEMAPPLRGDQRWKADVHGTPHLSVDEVAQIRIFCREHQSEHLANDFVGHRGRLKAYVIFPHVRVLEENGVPITKRFSCAGFVVEAYRDAAIDFIETDSDLIASVSKDVLSKAYPLVNHPRFDEFNDTYRWGLDPNHNEWPVVMPGYVLHALNRTDLAEIRNGRYCPQKGDELFPRKLQTSTSADAKTL